MTKLLLKTRKYKFCLYKEYFDTGYSLTSYFKWGIALFGMSSLNISITLIGFAVYGIVCFFIGKLWYKKGFAITQQEVWNQYNLFVKQMRKSKNI